jgi:predicted ABC-type transport system involved in lysophospholipase L1 biosynthesis ATPase subunit
MRELVLEFEGVAQSYRRGKGRWQMLSGVSLTVAAGEFVGLLGGRGEGKTTLLEFAVGLEIPEAGTVRFEGHDLGSCSDDERSDLRGDRIVWMPRADFGEFRVLQYVALPLAMGRRGMRAAEDQATEALKRVGVEHCSDRSWEDLSDWDRLLVTFARGYASRPRLMVLDDLLDGLGAAGTRDAGELLLGFARELGCGVLAGASDLGALLAAHRVLRFDGEGSLSSRPEPGNHTNLVDLRGRRRAVG